MSSIARSLHYVFKVADRTKSICFFKNSLNMRVLRHEEFSEGCEAACNGPYSGKWSKTMIGYGPEDNNFVLELTYNYGIDHYKHGNDYKCIKICGRGAFTMLVSGEYPFERLSESLCRVVSPCGYEFLVEYPSTDNGSQHLEEAGADSSPREAPSMDSVMQTIELYSSDLSVTKNYWVNQLGMQLVRQDKTALVLSYGDGQCQLVFHKASTVPIDHAKAYGRIAFATARERLEPLESLIKKNNYTILKNLVTLDTPGKASVDVVILADPDGHEICFVGDEGFRALSQVDPDASEALKEAILADKSAEWFDKRGGKQRQL